MEPRTCATLQCDGPAGALGSAPQAEAVIHREPVACTVHIVEQLVACGQGRAFRLVLGVCLNLVH